MNGYIDPVTLEERLAHIQAAKESLKTEFHWLCDNMENQFKHAMGDAPNSEFIVDPDGKVVGKRLWCRPEDLRQDLAKLVGPSQTRTTVRDLGYQIEPQAKQAARGVVPRLKLPGRMTPLKIESRSEDDDTPLYVKLRAEADDDLLRSGEGTLYLAFHLDPIHEVHWNNQVDPIEIDIAAPEGVQLSSTQLHGPKVEQAADADPREFLIDVRGADAKGGPIELTVKYFACDDAQTFCVPVTQHFRVQFERDPEAGWRMAAGMGRRMMGRDAGPGGPAGNRNRAAQMIQRMMSRDANGDHKLSPDEMPERARQMFQRMDADGDGFIDESEIRTMAERMGNRRRRGGGG